MRHRSRTAKLNGDRPRTTTSIRRDECRGNAVLTKQLCHEGSKSRHVLRYDEAAVQGLGHKDAVSSEKEATGNVIFLLRT
eukprot:5597967-Pleurochrysis_carterae.AAC.2